MCAGGGGGGGWENSGVQPRFQGLSSWSEVAILIEVKDSKIPSWSQILPFQYVEPSVMIIL